MAPSSSPTKYGRGRREIKKTARFEDTEIPGVNSALNLVRPKQPQDLLLPDSNGSTPQSQHSTGGQQLSTATMSKGKSDRQKKNKRKAAKDKAAGDSQAVANPASQTLPSGNKLADAMASTPVTTDTLDSVAHHSAPASQKARPRKKAALRNRKPQTQYFAAERAKIMSHRSKSGLAAKTKYTNATPETNLDLSSSFTHDKLKIYDWPAPLPTDFLDLHAWQKDWKAGSDALEAKTDKDSELEDWHELSGRRESYSYVFADLSMEYSVACSWIKHAKRAFRAGKSWKEFETEEREIDSQSKAKEIEDSVKRKEELSWALSDDFRLGVFELLKVMLCHEIWLEEYVVVAMPEGKQKKDSFEDVFASVAPQTKATPEPEASAEGPFPDTGDVEFTGYRDTLDMMASSESEGD